MKRKFIYIRFLLVFAFSIISNQVYPIDSLIVDEEYYKLVYIGNKSSICDLKSKHWAGYTFVNIPIDPTFYKQEYPNPFSPSTVKEQFLYRLEDSSDVSIVIIDQKDSVYFNLMLEEQDIGYYYFIIKSSYFTHSSINKKVLSSVEDIKIVFLIEDEKFIFPLRNITIDKPN